MRMIHLLSTRPSKFAGTPEALLDHSYRTSSQVAKAYTSISRRTMLKPKASA